jgi:hypothetical protein
VSPVRAGPVRDEKDGRYTVIALSRATCPPDHVKGPWWEYAGRTVKLPKAQMAFRNVLLTATIWTATVQMATTTEVG